MILINYRAGICKTLFLKGNADGSFISSQFYIFFFWKFTFFLVANLIFQKPKVNSKNEN